MRAARWPASDGLRRVVEERSDVNVWDRRQAHREADEESIEDQIRRVIAPNDSPACGRDLRGDGWRFPFFAIVRKISLPRPRGQRVGGEER